MSIKELTLLEGLKKKFSLKKKINLLIKVIPKSSNNEIVGLMADQKTLKIKITAIPEKGKANQQLIKLLSQTFSINQSQINIKSGHSSNFKMLEINF